MIIWIIAFFNALLKDSDCEEEMENRFLAKKHVCFYMYSEKENMCFFTWIFLYGLFHAMDGGAGKQKQTL